MVVINAQTVTPEIWIPPIYSANPKITIERLDGTVDDVTDICTYSFTDSVTEGIGNFEIEFPNPSETYTGIYTGMEIVRYYNDYSQGSSTTLRFRGRIEKPSYRNNYVRLTGRTESLFVFDIKVTASYIDTDGAVILLDLFNNYANGRYDLTDIPALIGVNLSVSWVDKPFWECVREICIKSNYDCYINPELIVKFFERASVQNQDEAIVHDINMTDLGEFTPGDVTFVRNIVRIYGGIKDGVQVFYTNRDQDSIDLYDERPENITDDNILTLEEAKTIGDSYLAENKDPPMTGTIKSIQLASIQPGEALRLSSPMDNLPLDYYVCNKYTSSFRDDEYPSTEISINKENQKVSHIIRDRIRNETKRQNATINQYNYDFCVTEFFDSDSGTHSDTEIIDGVLKLQDGKSTGNWISDAIVSSDGNDIQSVLIKPVGDNVIAISVLISVNNWLTSQSISINTPTSITDPGNTIKYKISFISSSTIIDSVAIQYTT